MPVALNTVQQTLQRVPISKSALYSLVRQGQVPSVTVAGRILIPETWIEQLVAQAETGRS